MIVKDCGKKHEHHVDDDPIPVQLKFVTFSFFLEILKNQNEGHQQESIYNEKDTPEPGVLFIDFLVHDLVYRSFLFLWLLLQIFNLLRQ